MPDLKLITEFGAFGVIAILLWSQWDERRRITRLVSNHLEHETASRDENTKVLAELVAAVSSLKEWLLRK